MGCENLGVWISGGGKEAQAHQRRTLATYAVDDHIVGGLWIGLVEHDAFVTGALEHRRQRHDSDRRRSPYPKVAPFCPPLPRPSVQMWDPHFDQGDPHTFM